MEIEILNAINEGMNRNLMMMIEIIMMILVSFVVAALVIYIVGTVRFCVEKPRPSKTAPKLARRGSSSNIWGPALRASHTRVHDFYKQGTPQVAGRLSNRACSCHDSLY